MTPPANTGRDLLISFAKAHNVLAAVIIISAAVFLLQKVSFFVSSIGKRPRNTLEHDCKPIPSYPRTDPWLSFGILIWLVKVIKQGNTVDEFGHIFEITSGDAKTITEDSWGQRTLHTMEPENFKTILSVRFKDWGHTASRVKMYRAVGEGPFSATGHAWESSRALLRPALAKTQAANIPLLEGHIANLLEHIPDGQVVDMQELFPLLTMDFTTDFILGESALTLVENDENSKAGRFTRGFNYWMNYIAFRGKTGRLGNLLDYFPNNAGETAVAVCREYLLEHVFKTRKVISDGRKSDNISKTDGKERHIFLQELVKNDWSSEKLVGGAFDVLGASRDTIAALLSIFFFTVSRHPDVMEKIRKEIENVTGSRPPTADDLKRFKYLHYSIKEIHRLHTIIPLNARVAVNDTVLPLGGGPEGKSPIFVPKGTTAYIYPGVAHRQKDIYGPDADEYRPERWEKLRVSAWTFMPFSGGPRICMGQDISNTTALYLIVRLLQNFRDIQPGDDSVWAARIALFTTPRSGCKLRMSRN